jgi:hypothetical protein
MNDRLEADFDQVVSPVTPIADPLAIPVNARLPHCFVGVEFFDNAAATTRVEPTAGTVAVQVETVNSPGLLEPALGSPVALSSGRATLNFAANAARVVVTPTSVSGNGASHYRAVLTANKS